MSLASRQASNAGTITNCGFPFLFNHLENGGLLLTLLLFFTAIASLFTGSIWLISFSLTALAVKLYPLLLLLAVIGAAGLIAFNIYRR